MEPLLKQLRELPARLAALPAGLRRGLYALAAVAALAVVVGLFVTNGSDRYEYVYNNLSPEDAAESGAVLKGAGIPFRAEAGGAAVAVPANKVAEARMLLATAGLPRGGGTVGYELLDRGDIGESERKQQLTWRRALEGELSRTVGKLAGVKSARVHLTLGETTMYRDEKRPAAAAVVVNLFPGRALDGKQLAGIRHLIASAVPGLKPGGVTVVDGTGAVLAAEERGGAGSGTQKEFEREAEDKILSLLETTVGAGKVRASVTAAFDAAEQQEDKVLYDAEGQVLRSERNSTQEQSQSSTSGGNVAGAQANVPLQPQAAAAQSGSQGRTTTEDITRNFDNSRTETRRIEVAPRLKKLSVSVLLDAPGGQPMAPETVATLEKVAKNAVGFDEARGDTMTIVSLPFASPEETAAPDAAPDERALPLPVLAAIAVAVLLALGAAAFFLSRRRSAEAMATTPALEGVTVETGKALLPQVPSDDAILTRARELAAADPPKAAALLRAWIASDAERRVMPSLEDAREARDG